MEITPALLDRVPLPSHDDDVVKHGRGTVLFVGGSSETAGAMILAGLAALRVGAGRLRIMTAASVAPAMQIALPEARVIPLRETADGAIDPDEADRIAEKAAAADATVVGAGILDPEATSPLVDAITSSGTEGVVVVDAGAIAGFGTNPEWAARLGARLILTPNGTEMDHLDGASDGSSRERCAGAAERLGCVVALRAPDTWVAAPDGSLFVHRGGNAGLATSGSGDVAAGVFGGLGAQGAPPLAAAVWAPYLHARAGDRLVERIARIGFLARELLDELPIALAELTAKR